MPCQLFSVSELTGFSRELLIKVGVQPENAAIITDTLLAGELRNVKSHGIIRLPTYISRIEAGVMAADAPVKTLVDKKAIALLDANNSFGQVAGYQAMLTAIQKAKKFGCGMAAVSNSNHFGITAYYSMQALKENMIGFVATNASPAMAPFRTKTALLGTNPLSIAIPAKNHPPIVLDMSTTVTARGKIRYAALVGEEIPLGCALDDEGKPTTDPIKALGGSLEPIGGVKGFGLSLIIDILCGLLTNTAMVGEVKNVTDTGGPAKTGHLFCALDIGAFRDYEDFTFKMDMVIDHIKGLPSIDGGPVYMVGELEHLSTLEKQIHGISLEQEVVESLNKLSVQYNSFPLKQV